MTVTGNNKYPSFTTLTLPWPSLNWSVCQTTCLSFIGITWGWKHPQMSEAEFKVPELITLLLHFICLSYNSQLLGCDSSAIPQMMILDVQSEKKHTHLGVKLWKRSFFSPLTIQNLYSRSRFSPLSSNFHHFSTVSKFWGFALNSRPTNYPSPFIVFFYHNTPDIFSFWMFLVVAARYLWHRQQRLSICTRGLWRRTVMLWTLLDWFWLYVDPVKTSEAAKHKRD